MKKNIMMPELLDSNIPFIYLSGQDILKILNYKKILQYHQNEISLLLNKKKLTIKGEGLNIDFFDEDEICIRGYIVSITYLGG